MKKITIGLSTIVTSIISAMTTKVLDYTSNLDVDMTLWILVICGIVALIGVFITYSAFKGVVRAIETRYEDTNEIMILRDTVNKRKQQYLYRCIQHGKLLPEPDSWLTDEELRLHRFNNEKRITEINEFNKSRIQK